MPSQERLDIENTIDQKGFESDSLFSQTSGQRNITGDRKD